MALRINGLAVALSLALIPMAWDHVQPRSSHADSPGANAQAANIADQELESVRGIQAWVHVLALSAPDDPVRRAPTLFVPSDGAMRALPDGMAAELVDPRDQSLRRAFLARSASDVRIELNELAGKRILLSTLDGRPLVIDATGGDIRVGDTEAIEIRTLPDGRSLFILDDCISAGSDELD
jgi:hypothetical protein